MIDAASLESIAARADRTMRTFAARSIAARLFETLADAESEAALLHALGSAGSWMRQDDAHFTCSFGERQVTITVPTPCPPPRCCDSRCGPK